MLLIDRNMCNFGVRKGIGHMMVVTKSGRRDRYKDQKCLPAVDLVKSRSTWHLH